DGDGGGIDQVAVEQVEVAALAGDLGQDVFLGELGIGGAAEEEFLETLHVEGRRRHDEDDVRRLVGRGAHGADVADGAIDEDAVDALVAALRGADREVAQAAVAVLLVDHAQRLVALARQVLRADLGQGAPDPVRETHLVFAAGGTVLEVLGRAGVVDGFIDAETAEQGQADQPGQGHGEQEEYDETAYRGPRDLLAFPAEAQFRSELHALL